MNHLGHGHLYDYHIQESQTAWIPATAVGCHHLLAFLSHIQAVVQQVNCKLTVLIGLELSLEGLLTGLTVLKGTDGLEYERVYQFLVAVSVDVLLLKQ